MATDEKPIVLDYSPPPKASARNFYRVATYVVAFAWSCVLALAMAFMLVLDVRRLSSRIAVVLTAGTILTAGMLLRWVGRAGCVTGFMLFALAAVAVIWLAVG